MPSCLEILNFETVFFLLKCRLKCVLFLKYCTFPFISTFYPDIISLYVVILLFVHVLLLGSNVVICFLSSSGLLQKNKDKMSSFKFGITLQCFWFFPQYLTHFWWRCLLSDFIAWTILVFVFDRKIASESLNCKILIWWWWWWG